MTERATPQSVLDAGIRAGIAWATSEGDLSLDPDEPPHKLKVTRLRSWCAWLLESQNWDYRFVYASMLTNKLVIDNTGDAGDNAELLAIEEASYTALEFWRRVPGWPADQNEWWSFIEGFVRGVASTS